jgi:DNA polymerase-3 subunit beta
MKFVVERDYLVDAVNWVSKSISNRPITTTLLGIIIDATDEITLSGSDLESSANAKLKADISQTGKVLVKYPLLVLRSLSFLNQSQIM